MFAFLLTICSLFLVYCSVPQNYVDIVKKRMSFAYSYFYPEKIVLKGLSSQQKKLLPNRYYSIICEESANLTLRIPDLQNSSQKKLYLIKNIEASGLSKITLLSDNNQLKIKINDVNLSDSATFDYSTFKGDVVIAKQSLSGLGKIHYTLNKSKS